MISGFIRLLRLLRGVETTGTKSRGGEAMQKATSRGPGRSWVWPPPGQTWSEVFRLCDKLVAPGGCGHKREEPRLTPKFLT